MRAPGDPATTLRGLPRGPLRARCGCSTRPRWAASGSWPSAAGWPDGPPLRGFAYRLRAEPHRTRPDPHRTRANVPIAAVGADARSVTASAIGRARPAGERHANLHARSARSAPRPSRLHGRASDDLPDGSGAAPAATTSPARMPAAWRRLVSAPCATARGTPPSGPRAHRPSDRPASLEGSRLTGIWYVVGFAFAGVSFVFLTIGAAWLISHRNRGDEHKGLPYEIGHRHVRRHPRPVRPVVLHLRPAVRRLRHRGRSSSTSGRSPSGTCCSAASSACSSSSAILLLGLAYAWRKGALTWR